MDIGAIIVFFIILYALGFTATYFVKKKEGGIEGHFISLGLGLAVFPLLVTILAVLRIPLYWWLVVLLSLLVPLYAAYKYFKSKPTTDFSFQFSLSKIQMKHIYLLLVLIIVLFSFYTNHKGAFSYPWLEDDDPWIHAIAASYVSQEKSALEPFSDLNAFQYMDAYPPAFDILMSLVHQVSGDMMWSLKFFNALIIAIGILSFFFFVKEFTGSYPRAVFATFVLAMLPSYLTHFIWAHSLFLSIIYPAFYCFERTKEDTFWMYPALVAVASLFLIQPTQPVKIAIMIGLYWVIRAVLERKWNTPVLYSSIVGVLVSFIIWWIPMIIKYGSKFMCLGLTQGECDASVASKFSDSGVIGALGGATREYTFNDFFIAKKVGMINTSVGIGVVVSILVALSIVYMLFKFKSTFSKENYWKPVTLSWFAFTLLGLFGGTKLPVALFTFRFWLLFAIPVAILSTEIVFILGKIARYIDGQLAHKVPSAKPLLTRVGPAVLILVLLLVAGVWYTSGVQRYTINTAMWPFNHQFSSIAEMQGYQHVATYPEGTTFFPLCDSALKQAAYGQDFVWSRDAITAWKRSTKGKDDYFDSLTVESLHSMLKANNFDYLIIAYPCARVHGVNETIALLNGVNTNQNLFRLDYAQQQGGVPYIFEII